MAGLPLSSLAIPAALIVATSLVGLARQILTSHAPWYFATAAIGLCFFTILGASPDSVVVSTVALAAKLLAAGVLLRGLVVFLHDEPPPVPLWQALVLIFTLFAGAGLALAFNRLAAATVLFDVVEVVFIGSATMLCLSQAESEDRFGWLMVASALFFWAATDLGAIGMATSDFLGRGRGQYGFFSADMNELVLILSLIGWGFGFLFLTMRADTRAVRLVMDRMSAGSMVDVESGLLNRRGLILRLGELIALHRRNNVESTVMLVAIDEFASTEARMGASWRQNALGALATRLAQSVRGYDILGYANEGRFLVILPHSDIVPAVNKANALRAGIQEVLAVPPVGPLTTGVAAIVTMTKTSDQTAEAVIARLEKILANLPSSSHNQTLVS